MARIDPLLHPEAHFQELDDNYKKTREHSKQKSTISKIISLPLALFHTTVFSALGSIAFMLLFPTFPWPLFVGLFAAGLVVEGFQFFSSIPKIFNILFVQGLFNFIEEKLVMREIERATENENFLANELKLLKQLFLAELREKKPKEFEALKELKKKKKEATSLKNKKKYTKKYNKALGKLFNPIKEKFLSEYILRAKLGKKNFIKERTTHYEKNGYPIKLAAKNTAKKAWDVQVRDHANKWKDPTSDRITLKVAAKIHAIMAKIRNELKLKKILCLIGIPFCLVCGIGFSCMAFTHLSALLALTALAPGGIIAVAGVIAGIAAFTFGIFILKTTIHAIIKNPLRTIYDELGLKRDEETNRFLHVLQCTFKLIPFVVLAAVGAVALTLMAGAWLDATLSVLTLILGKITIATNIMAQIVMFGIMLPPRILFSAAHCTHAITKFIDGGKYCFEAGKKFITETLPKVPQKFKDYMAELKKEKLKTIGGSIKSIITTSIKGVIYGTAFVIAFGSLIFHLAADAAMGPAEGANSSESWPGRLIQKTCDIVGVSAVITALVADMALEFLEHIDFAIIHFKSFAKPFWEVPTNIFAALKGLPETIKEFGKKTKDSSPKKEKMAKPSTEIKLKDLNFKQALKQQSEEKAKKPKESKAPKKSSSYSEFGQLSSRAENPIIPPRSASARPDILRSPESPARYSPVIKDGSASVSYFSPPKKYTQDGVTSLAKGYKPMKAALN